MNRDPHSILIRIAATLARGEALPDLERYEWQKGTGKRERKKLFDLLAAQENRHKALAAEIRGAADGLQAAWVLACEARRIDAENRGNEISIPPDDIPIASRFLLEDDE